MESLFLFVLSKLFRFWLVLDKPLWQLARWLEIDLPFFGVPLRLPITIALTVFTLALVKFLPSVKKPWRNKILVFLLITAWLIMLWAPIIVVAQSANVGGHKYWLLSDDAMISMRYAKNLAAGQGLVWNPGEKVEGYTNFLWTIYMACLHLLPLSAGKIMLGVLLTNLGLSALTAWLIWHLTLKLGGKTATAVLAVAAYTLSKISLGTSLTGLETTCLTFLVTLALSLIIQQAQSGQNRATPYLVISLIPLVRADGLFLAGLLFIFSFLTSPKKKLALIYIGAGLLPTLSLTIFRLAYYGELLPNTAYLKMYALDSRLIAGWRYVWKFIQIYSLPLILAVAGCWAARRRHQLWLLLFCLAFGFYVIFLGGDWFRNFRFFLPIWPLLLVLVFLGIQNLTRRPCYRWFWSYLCFFSIPLLLPGYQILNHEIDVFCRFDAANIEIGLLIKKNTAPEAKVADVAAGSIFYISDRYGIDLLGKIDKYIARLPAKTYIQEPGHNKFDFTYSLDILRPDIVVAGFRLPVSENQMKKLATGNRAFVGQLYFDPVFQKHFLPYPVPVATSRAIFVADWSGEQANRLNWKGRK